LAVTITRSKGPPFATKAINKTMPKRSAELKKKQPHNQEHTPWVIDIYENNL